MAKQFGEWLDEFVENGADPNNIVDWPDINLKLSFKKKTLKKVFLFWGNEVGG